MKKYLLTIHLFLFFAETMKAQISCVSDANCPAVPNASAGCVANNCQITSCSPGFVDCDGNYLNGCEANLAGSVNNCGSCGRVCSLPAQAASVGCAAGVCFISTCNAGFANCDGDFSNGCETALPVISGNTTICNNAITTLSANGGSSYLWSTGATTPAITISPGSTTVYSVTINGCAAAATSATVSIVPSSNPSINISAGSNAQNICSNNSITFTASSSNAGTTPTYQWYKNGTVTGTNSLVYSNASWANGDVINCKVTSNAACPLPAAAFSNNIVITLDNPAANTWQQKADLGFTQANGPMPTTDAVGFSIGNKGYIGTGYDAVNGYRKDFWEYDPVTNTWTQRADFGGTARYRAAGFSIGSKGYIGTGYDGAMKNDFWEYDPSANIWIQKANFGGVARDAAVGFSIGNKGYMGTGQVTGNYADFWEYNPATNVWTQKANFSATARFFAVGFSIGNKGYIGTGSSFSNNFYKDFWQYDPVLNTWTQKADFGGSSRTGGVGYSIGTKGYVALGVDGTTWRNDCWEYDPALNIWVQKANFGGSGRERAVGFTIGNKGYVGTGRTNSNYDYCQNDFWEYSPNTDTWLQKASFGGNVRYGAVGFNIGNKGYAGTGVNSVTSVFLKDFWEYDPALNVWTQKADFGGAPRSGAVGFSIGNKGYVGTGQNALNSNDFWEYNPLSNTWTQLADFGGLPRYGAVGFSIGNKGYIGTGLAYNPFTGTSAQNDFWEYDPLTNIWAQKADCGGVARYQAIGFAIGNNGYVGTGQSYTGVLQNDFWQYNPSTNNWIQRANFGGAARNSAVAFSIGSKGYLGTGYSSTGSQKDFWQYDPATNSWMQKANFGGTEHSASIGFSIGNKGYLGIGYARLGGPTNVFWEYSPTNTRINTGLVNATLCPGSSTLSYTIGCTNFNSGNLFTAQLSDSLGSFLNPLPLGTSNSTVSGNINITIPSNIQSGNRYRIRVVGSNPETIGTDNGQDIAFSAPPAAGITGTTTGCGSVRLTATGGSSFAWSGGNSANTAANTFNSSNTYTVTVTGSNGCTAAASALVTITTPPIWYLDADNDNYYIGTGISQCASPGANYKSTGLLGGNDCNDADNSQWQTVQRYADTDGDGFGSGSLLTVCYGNTIPSGYSTNNTDCAAADNTKWQLLSGYADADGDGYTTGSLLTNICSGASLPGGYSAASSGTDCNDADNSQWQTVQRYADTDGDGFGAGSLLTVCYGNTIPSGYSTNNTDCDDLNNTKWQSNILYIDADNDGYDAGTATICYGSLIPAGYRANTSGADCNDADISQNITYSFYSDSDGDSYGTGSLIGGICSSGSSNPPAGYSTNNTDCDDSDNTKWQSNTLYMDADNDGYDAGTATICYGSGIPAGYRATTSGADCNDADISQNITYSFYLDSDGDSYGTGSLIGGICSSGSSNPPAGYSTNNTDCDDNNSNSWQLLQGYTDADADSFTVGAIQNICSGNTLPQGYNGGSLGEDTDDNNPNVTTGINTLSKAGESVKIYPNPARSSFIVELQFDHGYHSLLLTDVTGKILQQSGIHSSVTKKEIDIRILSEGMYLVRLIGKSISGNYRLIKQ